MQTVVGSTMSFMTPRERSDRGAFDPPFVGRTDRRLTNLTNFNGLWNAELTLTAWY